MVKANAKVYINGRLIGFHQNPTKLTEELIEGRRFAKIDPQINIAYNDMTNEIYINTDSGRVQRPVIVVKDGKSMLTEKHMEKIKNNEISWEDLMEQGVLEYLDAEEEENARIAATEAELTKEHTHLEIEPAGILSVITNLIPFVSHNLSGKALHGAKMFKQAAGIGQINYNLRTDTEGYLLHYPQKNLVKTKTTDLVHTESRPQSQNFVVAILPYYGFNTLDAVVINKGAVDRSLGRMAYFRTYEAMQTRYPGGQKDKFEVPNEETVGYLGKEFYQALGEDGLAEVESRLSGKDVIVGRTSPPRFLEEVSEFGVVKERRRESSVTSRKGKEGYIDKILITESTDGDMLVKAKVRSDMCPEVGDKFSSRHGQKGVVGAIVPEEDMPFTADGIKPDLLLNPHSIPSRMTIGHLLEMLAGKASCMQGEVIDGTPFCNANRSGLEQVLLEHGLRPDGREVLYDGISGQRIEGKIFIGVVGYRRLYHMVAHKLQARARGPVQILTRQPTEGKEKEGGLRFGEMEGETLVGHGASMLLQEKFIDDSDKVVELVCEKCGIIAVNDRIRNKRYCSVCGSSRVYPAEMSYGFKLMLDELKALGVYPKLNLVDKA
ncbi:MAG: DNA-directed RNA polymerase subunit B [Candidatus Diapherotrites archaeon]